ncbi:hypothetical protein ARAM_000109 [Aspergillus rambellii]|uniref:P-type Ca(2+) transporter n=1 Tax=Aspergillus rambellii TaxID=308745 RepID=A0A0F8WT14_9EURO|nr:hypothetical protein ARAM_000109 [Aspergillus rambellii]
MTVINLPFYVMRWRPSIEMGSGRQDDVENFHPVACKKSQALLDAPGERESLHHYGTFPTPSSPSVSLSGDDTSVSAGSLSVGGSHTSFVETAASYAHDSDRGSELQLHPHEELDTSSHATFPVSPDLLDEMIATSNVDLFMALGGISGIVASLFTHRDHGLNAEHRAREDSHQIEPTLTDRRKGFGVNILPQKQSKSFLELVYKGFDDHVLILLSVVAAISLALGLYQAFGPSHNPDEPRVEWVEGVTILIAVAIVVVVAALSDLRKERQFAELNRKVFDLYKPESLPCVIANTIYQNSDHLVTAVRSGRLCQISKVDVVVGDVLYIQPGDVLPADGVVITGNSLRCDESSISGESDQKRKTQGDKMVPFAESNAYIDPFLFAGTTVLEGVGTYLVTSVGVRSTYGKLVMSLMEEEIKPTPLQVRLTIVANQLATAGVTIAIFLFVILITKYWVGLGRELETPMHQGQHLQQLLRITLVSIAVIVVAVPEGLPLAVTLALAFAVTRMLKDNNLVRVFSSCETMGNATSLCSDKTGTLTQNEMTVTAGVIGANCEFKGLPTDVHSSPDVPNASFSNRIFSGICEEIQDLVSQSIVINSTAFEEERGTDRAFVGSRTESALLIFALRRLGVGSITSERRRVPVIRAAPFDCSKKYMATVVDLGGTYRMYVKGAPEVLLARSTQALEDVYQATFNTPVMDSNMMAYWNGIMDKYTSQSLRMIALAYRDFHTWPPQDALSDYSPSCEVPFDHLVEDMTFIGVLGLQDPVRPQVPETIIRCQHAGVTVRMVTGDSVGTATAVAQQCGILQSNSLVLEGSVFRSLSRAQIYTVIPRLHVLARSNPADKLMLVKYLRELGEIVAVTGDGTNDGPALQSADVGFAMGIAGTEIARQASSIVLIDDDFTAIVKAIQWGRSINDSVKKFLQFQVTVSITAVALTVVSAIISKTEESILTPVQLLWVNLIMDTFAALALATDPPSASLLDAKPEPRSAPLISVEMWEMILGQSLYQIIVVLLFNFAGDRFLYRIGPEESFKTLVFNIFVWMQFFNLFK